MPYADTSSPMVSLTECRSYEAEALASALAQALEPLGGMRGFITPGTTVLLKPNLLKRAVPDDAVTTHPELVRAVIRAVRQCGAGSISVGDSPGGPPNERLFRSLTEASGLAAVCAEEDVPLIQFTSTVRSHVTGTVPHARFAYFDLAAEAARADVLINLPKLKTHGFMGMTGAVKNLFGLIPGLEKAAYHVRVPGRSEFADMLVDLALARTPELTVMDAIVGMEGQGPGGGEPKPIGALLASADPFAMDVVAAALCRFVPGHVHTLQAAHRRGLSPLLAEEVRCAGADWRSLVPATFAMPPRDATTLIPRWAGDLLRNALLARPRLARPDECTACGICARSCPVDAIRIATDERLERRAPSFDYDACIRCYCCHELCPPQALELHAPWLLRALTRAEQGPRRDGRQGDDSHAPSQEE